MGSAPKRTERERCRGRRIRIGSMVNVSMYIYIYIERERDRDIERERGEIIVIIILCIIITSGVTANFMFLTEFVFFLWYHPVNICLYLQMECVRRFDGRDTDDSLGDSLRIRGFHPLQMR